MRIAPAAPVACVVGLSALLGLSGCGEARLGELEGFVAEVKQRRPAPLEPVPQIKQIDNFIYEPDGRRSPFVMDEQSAETIAPETGGTGLSPDPLRRREVLENYSLDSLRMAGTLEQDDQTWALILSPDGILHRVSVGNYLGRNHGRITSINAQGIELTELVDEGVNEWVERQASIALAQ